MKKRQIGRVCLLVMALLGIIMIRIPARAMPNYSTYNNQPNGTDGFDTYLAHWAVTSNYGSTGEILVGSSGGETARTLIKFDLSSIPSDATVTAATLTLTISYDLSSNVRDYKIYQALRNWNDDQATWNEWTTGNSWTTAGAGSNGNDINLSTVWATATMGASDPINTNKDFVFNSTGISELQKMVNGTYTNYGWMIKADTENNDRYNFYSSAATTSSYRPKLVIQYDEANTSTPTNTATSTETLTPTNTPTSTVTSTPTDTPLFTPTDTSTPTETFTPTYTGTATYTPTPSNTSTPLPTATPGNGVIWATGPVTLSAALLDEIGDLLTTNPPSDATTNIYAATNVSGVDTAWNVSIVNLVGVLAPYTEWNMEDNAGWAWFVECNGAEPVWSCNYYTLPAGGGSGSLRWPWKTGYSAQYGIMGVHTGASMIPGSSAIDLLGRDSIPSSMPPIVVAAANGIITSICSDGTSMAIRVDGGPVPLAYFHFDTGQTFTVGQSVIQGQVLGQLRYGSFIGSKCGYAVQQDDQYHIHFVFMPTSPGYLEIGGCVLDMNTRGIVCNGHTYGTLKYIPNGGESTDPNNPTPAPGENPPTLSGGGTHIWDGIVDMIVQFSSNTLNQYLPAQLPVFSYVLNKVELTVESLISIFMVFFMTGLSGSYILIILIAILAMELTYIAGVIVLTVAKWII
jgi:hypothetical protein